MPRQAPGKQSYGHLPKSTSEILLLTQTIIGAHLHGILHIGSIPGLSSPTTATMEPLHPLTPDSISGGLIVSPRV